MPDFQFEVVLRFTKVLTLRNQRVIEHLIL